MNNNNLNRLKVVLAEKNISNKALAEMVGVSPATISKWVTNTSQPHLDMLIKLSRCLNVMVNDLIRFPNDENIKSE